MFNLHPKRGRDGRMGSPRRFSYANLAVLLAGANGRAEEGVGSDRPLRGWEAAARPLGWPAMEIGRASAHM